MKNLSRFLIPLGLAVCAFVFNWMAVQPQLGQQFVVVNADVAADQPLTEGKLTAFKIVGEDFNKLKLTLVPWEERASLIGLPVQRSLSKGDFVFWQDVRYVAADFLTATDEVPLHLSLEGVNYEPSLLKVGNRVSFIVPTIPTSQPAATTTTGTTGANPPADGAAPTVVEPATISNDPATAAIAAQLRMKFEELGPFRILSVGRRTGAAPNENDNNAARRSSDQNVTLAVKLDQAYTPGDAAMVRALPEAARRLLAAQGVRRSDGRNIVAMVLYQEVERFQRLREAAVKAAAAPSGTAAPSAVPSSTK